MRRAQSVRHRARTSTVTGDELGTLTEDQDASPEDTLRRQLLELGRENDRLMMENQKLKHDLQRRGSEAHEECHQEIKHLEMLFTGAQRDNEAKMAELERSKMREKMLERELARLAGENWQTALGIPSSSDMLGSSQFRSRSPSPSKGARESQSRAQNGDSNATLLHIEQIRMLILGMDEKLKTREESLQKTVERAEKGEKDADALYREAVKLDKAVGDMS